MWRIVLSMRQPAFLLHVWDTVGEDAETLCTLLVHHGRLTLRQLTQAFAAAQAGDSATGADPAKAVASLVATLLNARIIEQVWGPSL